MSVSLQNPDEEPNPKDQGDHLPVCFGSGGVLGWGRSDGGEEKRRCGGVWLGFGALVIERRLGIGCEVGRTEVGCLFFHLSR